MNKKGFTLIELLIVLVILSVLAAVAIPAYTGYLAKAKEKVATENWDAAARLVKAEIAKRNISRRLGCAFQPNIFVFALYLLG